MKRLPPEFFRAPYEYYAALRAEGPVHPIEFRTGLRAWLVVGYDAARQLLRDPTVRKDPRTDAGMRARGEGAGRSGLTAVNHRLSHHMLNADAARHARLRRAVTPAFAPARLDALTDRIREITHDLLDRMAAAPGPVDLMTEFAFPLPITVICELLGVPFADRELFRDWSTIVSDTAMADPHDMRVATDAIVEYFDALIAARRSNGLGDDLLSGLIATSDEQDGLDDDELISMAFVMLIAGHETTVNLLGNTVLTLLTDRSRYRRLCERPDEIPGLVEEMLRYDGPVNMSTMRYTTAPTTVGGVTIPAEELVLVALGSADHDESHFTDAARFDPARDTGGHLAFGYGAHFCLGAGLARLEARIALTALLERCPDLRLAVDTEDIRWRESILFRAVHTLPVESTPVAAAAGI
ncbi:cytochrome P450 family protein [Nocardia bovistercoris]|uniref:Cytochrome P450 n=1 Tax=Nocardia bovistercoris TaxID=2785916 RepID=A0A931I5R5_9NOCA|nr:cytochrome P450 [Nocardia bovistercoris]MBH0775074.1 cytochrome P450 [Nocardia bovistercoris]